MTESSHAGDHPRIVPDETGRIVCHKVGQALHGRPSYADAARELLSLGLTLAVSASHEESNAILDDIEDQIVRLHRKRRESLYRALDDAIAHSTPGSGTRAWLLDQKRRRAA